MSLAERPYKIHLLTNYQEKLVDSRSDPSGLDYKTGLNTRLHPDFTFDTGRLVMVKYFKNFDGTVFSDLILQVEISYTDDANGNAKMRTTTRKWSMDNDEFGPHVKVTDKFYDSRASSREGVTRRTNIVNNLLDQSDDFGAKELFKVMFRSIDLDIIAYKETGDDSIIASIAAYESGTSEGAWLESKPYAALPDGNPMRNYTLRQLIMGALSI